MNKKKIFIAIPNLGCVSPSLVSNLLQWSHDLRYQITIYMPEGISPLDAARNRCVKAFLERDDDYLWFIDSDIIPPVEALLRLIQADKDAIGAVCFSMKAEQGEYFPYPVTLRYNEDKKYVVYYGKGVEPVDATGGACVMFKRRVFETIEKPYEFLYYPDGTLKLTCDFYIFQKLQKVGFELFIDFDVLCDHQRKVSIKGIQDLLSSLRE
jgi:glycosyltransferase involved in cell wall biosynthesis